MTMVVASLLEIANDHPVLLVLMVLALASMGGGVPPMIERRRRRAIERGLPTPSRASRIASELDSGRNRP